MMMAEYMSAGTNAAEILSTPNSSPSLMKNSTRKKSRSGFKRLPIAWTYGSDAMVTPANKAPTSMENPAHQNVHATPKAQAKAKMYKSSWLAANKLLSRGRM